VPVELHIVSDSTGETAARLVQALEAQFPEQEFEEVRHPRCETIADLERAVMSARGHAAVEEVLQAAIDLGGTITGEHGVGLAKRAFLAREQSRDVIELQRRLKLAFDPDNLLNPGKILPPPER